MDGPGLAPGGFMIVGLIAAVGLYSDGALAQESGVAEALFRGGRHSMEIGDYATACADFAESQRLDPSPGTLLNLAICEEHLGHLVTAWTKYRELADLPLGADPRVAIAQKGILALEPRLPRLRIIVNSSSPDSVVKLDGVELRAASLLTYVPVDPGLHRITLSTPARPTIERQIRIAVAERADVELSANESNVVSEPAPPIREAHEHPPPSSLGHHQTNSARRTGNEQRLRIAGYVAGGAGLAGFVSAGVLSVFALREKRVLDEHCQRQQCDEEGIRAAATGNRLLRLSDVGLVVGAGGVIAGGILLWQASRAQVRVDQVAGGASLSYSRALP